MAISRIDTDEYIYFNVHAEEVVVANFFGDHNSGIYGDRLQTLSFQRISESIATFPSNSQNLVLDFKNINACQQNLNKLIFDLKRSAYLILFLNLKKELVDELFLSSTENQNNKINKDGNFDKFFFFDDNNHPFTKVVIRPIELFQNLFKEKIKPLISKYGEPHTSSYVYLTSYVDVKRLMSHHRELVLYAIYLLALKISKLWQKELSGRPILICQSMNSSFIVSILSTMLKLDILLLDKIGPINKLYNRLDKNIATNKQYIVVSDLVCLGTEVKIVKNLIEFMGGNYLGNVSIIKTETLKKAHIKKRDATVAVFSINRSNNKELGYSITTDLEPVI